MTVVSVITPTWQRHDLLLNRCIPSVRAQTFPKIQHVVVSDGPDPDLDLGPSVVFDQLPDHPEGLTDYGSRARNRGLELASGDYIAYLDDDNAFRPDHVAALVAVLDANPDADFAYSKMYVHWSFQDYEIGSPQPEYGGIDTSLLMHRAGLPQQLGMWPLPDEIAADKHAPDWGAVERWLRGGARWVHVPEITVDYYR